MTATEPFRVAVTGSRHWDGQMLLWGLLDTFLAVHHSVHLIHGACPPDRDGNGADHFADRWAADRAGAGRPVTWRGYPAEWDGPCTSDCSPGHRRPHRTPRTGTWCPAAGPTRNYILAAHPLNLCLAMFQPGEPNNGTRHCANAMTAAGVPVAPYGNVTAWRR